MEEPEIICIIVIVVGMFCIYAISKHLHKVNAGVREGMTSGSTTGKSTPATTPATTQGSASGNATGAACAHGGQSFWMESNKTLKDQKDDRKATIMQVHEDVSSRLVNLISYIGKNDANESACAAYNTANTKSWIAEANALVEARQACEAAASALDGLGAGEGSSGHGTATGT